MNVEQYEKCLQDLQRRIGAAQYRVPEALEVKNKATIEFRQAQESKCLETFWKYRELFDEATSSLYWARVELDDAEREYRRLMRTPVA